MPELENTQRDPRAAPTLEALSLRPARPADAARLTELAHAAKAHWGYDPVWLAAWKDDLTVTPASIVRDRYTVAELEGVAIGFVAVSRDGHVAEVEHLWVDPVLTGRGIGRRLVEDALAWCGKTGVDRLRILSDPNAEGFYERLGAVRIGEVPSTPPSRRLPLLELRPPGA